MGSNSKVRMSLYGGAMNPSSLVSGSGAVASSVNYTIARSPQVNKKFRRDYYIASNNTVGSA